MVVALLVNALALEIVNECGEKCIKERLIFVTQSVSIPSEDLLLLAVNLCISSEPVKVLVRLLGIVEGSRFLTGMWRKAL